MKQINPILLIGFLFYAFYQFFLLILYLYQRIEKTLREMGEIKIGIWLLQLSGFGCWLWAIIEGWGDIKSIALFLLGVVFAGYKIYNIHLDTSKKKLNLIISGTTTKKIKSQVTILKWIRN
jgi:hypothetical protein